MECMSRAFTTSLGAIQNWCFAIQGSIIWKEEPKATALGLWMVYWSKMMEQLVNFVIRPPRCVVTSSSSGSFIKPHHAQDLLLSSRGWLVYTNLACARKVLPVVETLVVLGVTLKCPSLWLPEMSSLWSQQYSQGKREIHPWFLKDILPLLDLFLVPSASIISLIDSLVYYLYDHCIPFCLAFLFSMRFERINPGCPL